VHLEKPRPKRKAPSLLLAIVVVGLTPDGGFAMGFDRPDRFVVQVNMRGTQAEARAKLLEVCRGLSGRAYFGEDLTPEASKAICTPTFPFSALEMDSHVGKHTLTIGDAGGFFAAASHEGLYPAMWSAKIAVKVILEAHKSTFTQDGLISFDTAWRLEMGDFLRPPNTDLQLLLPLIFSNQPMADRMASAFFAGENI
jgi:flavin-dependent dehydrogenase